MKISAFTTDATGGRKRVSATVTWEDCDRPPCEVYFEADHRFAENLRVNPDAFLVACLIPAFVHGETRVLVEGEVCPELCDGLRTAMCWLRHWYYPSDWRLVHIEAKARTSILKATSEARTGLCFSGGIDSLATLRWNRLHIPREHPASIKDGVLIFGLLGEDAEMCRQVEAQLSLIADEAGVTLMPIGTNIVKKLGSGVSWADQWQASVLSAVAHALTSRLSDLVISATDDVRNILPYGSHPVLDPNYSSSDLRIRHHGIILSRLAKTRLVADWDTALQNLRVCNKIPHGGKTGITTLNCGKCEKCIRTMLALLVLGVLHRTRAFSATDLDVETIGAVVTEGISDVRGYYHELVPLLREQGRTDLLPAVMKVVKAVNRAQRIAGWKARARDLDRKYLGAGLTRLRRVMRSGTFLPEQGL
jgi:hypothetical protein